MIVEDVPPGALAVARGRQRNVDGWVARMRPGSASARAASASGSPSSPVSGADGEHRTVTDESQGDAS